MTTQLQPEPTSLQDELRTEAENWDEHETDHVYSLMRRAADKIDALTAERDKWKWKTEVATRSYLDLITKLHVTEAERDAAIAKLDALEKQEPLGYCFSDTRAQFSKGVWSELTVFKTGDITTGRKLMEPVYSQPVPASPAPITREGCNYLAVQGTVCNKCGEVHK